MLRTTCLHAYNPPNVQPGNLNDDFQFNRQIIFKSQNFHLFEFSFIFEDNTKKRIRRIFRKW